MNRGEFHDAKVGDEVYIGSRWGKYELALITHVTPARVQVKGRTFVKKTGYEYGASFDAMAIYPVTPENVAWVEEGARKEQERQLAERTRAEFLRAANNACGKLGRERLAELTVMLWQEFAPVEGR